LKRLLVHGAAFNLSLILRKVMGVGKPRRLQGLCLQLLEPLARLLLTLWTPLRQDADLWRCFALQSRPAVNKVPGHFGESQVTRTRLAA
jgi:hypothetical protein